MQTLDLLSDMWAAWCASRGVKCRDALEMSCDESLPFDIRRAAQAFCQLWESFE